MVTDHPTPEALAARLRRLADESPRPAHATSLPEKVRLLYEAADLLEAQQRQIAVARRLASALKSFLEWGQVCDCDCHSGETCSWCERARVCEAALREAREAGLAEMGGDRE